MRYFQGTLQLNYVQSKLGRIFWILPLERTTLKLLINAETGKSNFTALGHFPLDRSHILLTIFTQRF